MNMNLLFIVNSVLLGAGLAMDAFSVSIADGLNEPGMPRKRMCMIAGTYAFFQFLMPVTGWCCVHFVAQVFTAVQKYIPLIALMLLLFIGGKMIMEGVRGGDDAEEGNLRGLDPGTLILQGIATSIDALSVGFTIASYNMSMAVYCSVIIACVTFVICMGGLIFGRLLGSKFAGRAGILGGCILVAIGLEIFIRGI